MFFVNLIFYSEDDVYASKHVEMENILIVNKYEM